jgi:hypothetical protein
MRWSHLSRGILAGLEKALDRVLCVVGALGLAQMPEFMQQYLQRLGGHLDEARRQLESFVQAARVSGLTLDQLIARASSDPDPALVRLGGVARDAATRVEHLAAAESALSHASVWTRLPVFVRYLDWDIAAGTWKAFRPAMPTTLEGLAYAVVGVLLALGFYHGLVRRPLVRLRRSYEARRNAALEPRADLTPPPPV